MIPGVAACQTSLLAARPEELGAGTVEESLDGVEASPVAEEADGLFRPAVLLARAGEPYREVDAAQRDVDACASFPPNGVDETAAFVCKEAGARVRGEDDVEVSDIPTPDGGCGADAALDLSDRAKTLGVPSSDRPVLEKNDAVVCTKSASVVAGPVAATA